jgi:hypothetical protein
VTNKTPVEFIAMKQLQFFRSRKFETQIMRNWWSAFPILSENFLIRNESELQNGYRNLSKQLRRLNRSFPTDIYPYSFSAILYLFFTTEEWFSKKNEISFTLYIVLSTNIFLISSAWSVQIVHISLQ